MTSLPTLENLSFRSIQAISDSVNSFVFLLTDVRTNVPDSIWVKISNVFTTSPSPRPPLGNVWANHNLLNLTADGSVVARRCLTVCWLPATPCNYKFPKMWKFLLPDTLIKELSSKLNSTGRRKCSQEIISIMKRTKPPSVVAVAYCYYRHTGKTRPSLN